MATRRYHKKRVARKSRRSGKVRGNKLVKGGGPEDALRKEIDPTTLTQFSDLHDLIRTKRSSTGIVKELYQIKILENPENVYIQWIPRAGSFSIAAARVVTGVVQAANAVKNTFGWTRNAIGNIGKNEADKTEYESLEKLFPAAEFKKNLEKIYGEKNIKNLDSITSAPIVKVTLTPSNIAIGDETVSTDKGVSIKLLSLELPLEPENFKKNVLNFYKSIQQKQ